MSLIGKNLKLDDRVQIYGTTDAHLDTTYGTVIGTSVQGLINFHIVYLDEPHPQGDRAVVLPESNLNKVPDNEYVA